MFLAVDYHDGEPQYQKRNLDTSNSSSQSRSRYIDVDMINHPKNTQEKAPVNNRLKSLLKEHRRVLSKGGSGNFLPQSHDQQPDQDNPQRDQYGSGSRLIGLNQGKSTRKLPPKIRRREMGGSVALTPYSKHSIDIGLRDKNNFVSLVHKDNTIYEPRELDSNQTRGPGHDSKSLVIEVQDADSRVMNRPSGRNLESIDQDATDEVIGMENDDEEGSEATDKDETVEYRPQLIGTGEKSESHVYSTMQFSGKYRDIIDEINRMKSEIDVLNQENKNLMSIIH